MRSRGLSMIELVLAMFLVFLAAAFVMSLFIAGHRGFPRQHENTLRMSLAQAKMDEVMSLPYPYYAATTYRDRVLALDTPTASDFPAPYQEYTYDVDVTNSFQGSDRAHMVSVTVVSPNGSETTLRGIRAQAPATIDAGEALYEAYGCVGCHTLDHQPTNSVGETNPSGYTVPGSQGRVGPSHNLIGTRGVPPGSSAPNVVEYIKESVREPDAYVVPGFEPYMAGLPLTAMPPEDLDVLAEWLVEVTTPPPDPPPPPPPPDPDPDPDPDPFPDPDPPPPPPPPDPTCVDTTGTCLPGVY